MDDDLREERRNAVAQAGELLFDYFVDGGSWVRITIDPFPDADWQEISAPAFRRYPEGDVKYERLIEGLVVEFVRARPEPAPTQTIPIREAL